MLVLAMSDPLSKLSGGLVRNRCAHFIGGHLANPSLIVFWPTQIDKQRFSNLIANDRFGHLLLGAMLTGR
jgi:hypothetical protein